MPADKYSVLFFAELDKPAVRTKMLSAYSLDDARKKARAIAILDNAFRGDRPRYRYLAIHTVEATLRPGLRLHSESLDG